MTPDSVARAERILDCEARTWAVVRSRGYSLNEHWSVGLADGTTVFLKEGHVDPSPQWVRDEHAVFEKVDGPFMPRCLAFEDGEHPLLILEDLMPAYWPPPWRDGDVELVLEALEQVATVRPELRRVEEGLSNGWRKIEEDPAPFLGTGLRDAAWLERWLPELVAAADVSIVRGDSLLHGDV